MACCRGASRTAPICLCNRAPTKFLATTHGALRTGCRGDAVRRPGTVVHAGPTSPNTSARVHRTPGATHRVAPTLPARRVCSVEEADRKLPAVSNEATKRRLSLPGRGRRAAPGEGRLRGGSTFDPLPHLSSSPSPYPGRGRGVDVAWCGGVTVCTSQLHGREKTPLPGQGEAGAQRRVRVDPVVARPVRVHVVCDPAPRLAAAIPSR